LQQLFVGQKHSVTERVMPTNKESKLFKVGGLDLSRRDLDQDLDLDAQKVSVSTVEKISTVFKS
jgi:hypothetical protein